MFDFISVPVIVGLICWTIYGFFELLIRKSERLKIIDKIGDGLDPSMLGNQPLASTGKPSSTFSPLRIGCLMCGIGLGILVGFLLSLAIASNRSTFDFYNEYLTMSCAYGAPVLLLGGLGLVIAYIIERKAGKGK